MWVEFRREGFPLPAEFSIKEKYESFARKQAGSRSGTGNLKAKIKLLSLRHATDAQHQILVVGMMPCLEEYIIHYFHG